MDTWKRIEARHGADTAVPWTQVAGALEAQPEVAEAVWRMEATGGEPGLVQFPDGSWWWVDLVAEAPDGRCKVCYDGVARLGRRQNPPASSAQEAAGELGTQLLDEADYLFLQAVMPLDQKTSTWLHTPPEVRALGGALFGDRRFGRAFIYHNGAASYYTGRGYRTKISMDL